MFENVTKPTIIEIQMSSELEPEVAKSSNGPSFMDTRNMSKGLSRRLNFQRETTGRSIRCQKAMIE